MCIRDSTLTAPAVTAHALASPAFTSPPLTSPALISQHRERLAPELFPQHPGHVATHHPDPVEQRMFEVLDQGEDFVAETSGRIPEQPRFAFAAGLVTLFLLGALLAGAGRAW